MSFPSIIAKIEYRYLPSGEGMEGCVKIEESFEIFENRNTPFPPICQPGRLS